MMMRIVTAYRTRRWFRWSVDAATVLVLVVVVAVAHTILLSGRSPLQTFQGIQNACGKP
jgi:hypothetical protein